MGSEHNRSPSPSRSRSPSAESNRSAQSNSSRGSNASNHSRSASRSRSRSRSGSKSHTGSPASNRSNRSRSRSAQSNVSAKSGSKSKSRSRSHSSRSRSRSRSRSGSNKSNASRNSRRSGSHSGSNRSRSRSHSKSKSRSRSRSKSRSRSMESGKSNQSNRSGSRSKSAMSNKSAQSRSRSRTGSRLGSRSRSTSLKPKSDNEDKAPDGDADAADLFGDADDISSDEDKGDKGKEAPSARAEHSDTEMPLAEAEDPRASGDEREDPDDEDKEAEPEPIPETRIDVKIPKISCDLGKELHFVKLPNFLSVETRPFDPETYEDEIDEEETLDEEGRARLKLKVENTIRWKEEVNKDGDLEKHSNARLVRWSDGSLSLHLGSEIFDVYKQPLQGDHNHLYIRQGTGLQGQAVFRTKLSFRPHSTESFTHRKMTLSLADRSQKTTGIKILSQVGVDPDQDRKTLLKKEEEKLRQTFRVSKPRKRGDSSRIHASHAFREEEGSDEEGAISLNAIKNKYKSGAHLQSKGGAIYSSDEEGSDFEARRSKKTDKAKALVDSDTSDDSD